MTSTPGTAFGLDALRSASPSLAPPSDAFAAARIDGWPELYAAYREHRDIARQQGSGGIPSCVDDRCFDAEELLDVELRAAGYPNRSDFEATLRAAKDAISAAGLGRAAALLRESAAVAEAERARDRDQQAASVLHAKVNALVPLASHVQALKSADQQALHAPRPEPTALREASARLDAARAELAAEHPVVAAIDLDFTAFVLADLTQRGAMIETACDRSLEAIATAKKKLDEDPSRIFAWDQLRDATLDALDAGPGLRALAEDQAKTIEHAEQLRMLLMMSCAMAAAASGQPWLVTALEIAVGADGALHGIDDFIADRAAARTHLDRAKALSSDDPSLVLVALDVAGLIVDVGAAAKAFRDAVREARHLARGGARANRAAFEDAVTELADNAHVDRDVLRDQLQRAARREVELARLQNAPPSWLRDLAKTAPGIERSPAAVGLARLSSETRAAVITAARGNIDKLFTLGRAAAELDDAALALHRASNHPELIRAIVDGDPSEELFESIAHRSASPAALETLAKRIAGAPELSRAARLVTLARETLPLTERARRLLEAELGAPIRMDPTTRGVVLEERPLVLRAGPEASARDVRALAGVVKLHREAQAIARDADALLAKTQNPSLRAAIERIRDAASEARSGGAEFAALRRELAGAEKHIASSAGPARPGAIARELDRAVDAAVIANLGTRTYERGRGWIKIEGVFTASEADALALVTRSPGRFERALWVIDRVAELPQAAAALSGLSLDDLAKLQDAIDGFARGTRGGAERGRRIVAALASQDPPALRALAKEAGRLQRLERWPEYRRVSALEGKTLAEIEADAALSEKLRSFYFDRGGRPTRRPGASADVPRLAVEKDGTLRFRADGVPSTRIPKNATAGDLDRLLAHHSPSWPGWRSALVQEAEMTDAEIAAVIDAQMAKASPPRTIEDLRRAVKRATRDRLIDRCFAGAPAAAESHRRFTRMLGRIEDAGGYLNSADRGNLAERWSMRYDEVYRGAKLEAHPRLRPDQRHNAGVRSERVPDLFDSTSHELVEVKATTRGLDERDVAQIEAVLDATSTRTGAMVTLASGTAQVNRLRLRFIHVSGALGSEKQLYRWLEKYRGLAFEVFDTGGELHRLDLSEIHEIERSGSTLREQLEAWTKP